MSNPASDDRASGARRATIKDVAREAGVSFKTVSRVMNRDGHVNAERRAAVETAMAMVDVIRSGELSRLRICAADDCEDVVVDLSKNRSKRYCEGTCGNRANVAAYRARKATTA